MTRAKARVYTLKKYEAEGLRSYLPTYKEMAEIGEEIAKQRALLSPNIYGNYPETYSIKGPSLTDEGLVFYSHDRDQYDDYYNITPIVVSWEDIEDHNKLLPQLAVEVARKKEADERAQKKWRREQYERMRREFSDD